MEIIDIVDENLNFIRTAKRGEKLKTGEFFKFIHVWIVEEGKILIQKRGYDRRWAAGKWATHTGVVSSGENVDFSVVREIKEEMGATIDLVDIELEFIIRPNNYFNGIGYIYFVKSKNLDIEIDNDEVIDYKYVDFDTLKSMIKNNQFINYGNNGREYSNYFEKVFKKLENLLEVNNE
ncbi:MAG: NUDIX domain-containing protein [Bacilli bacterium]